MCCENVEFWKWEAEAVWGILTRAVALDGQTGKLVMWEEAVMAPLFFIFTIFSLNK
jgi:hypothetical protein